MKSRILFVFASLIVLWFLMLGRATYLQIFPNIKLKALQEKQFQTVITLQSRRGAILDRKGRDLALSTTAYSLYADPKILRGKQNLAKRLGKELGVPSHVIYSKIKHKDKRFNWIMRLIPKEKFDVIKSWDIRGLSFVEEFKRVYPNDSLLAHSLGFIGTEGQGLEGIELQYDQLLRGNTRKVMLRRDARGRPLLADGMLFTDIPDGAEIHLTIDSEMQHMMEGELYRVVEESAADQAFGVILDVKTSAILALASTPSFDANQAMKIPPDIRRNRVIADTFEPGSTLKTFTIATALKEKIVAPNTKYDTEGGRLKVANRIIREADASHSWSNLTVSDILSYSSNVGITKIAFDLGAESLRKGLLEFGFGTKSGVDLPGEAKGSLQNLPWKPHLLSNISFGQGITATPLQIANAYAAIANGGTLNTPFIIGSIKDPETGEVINTRVKPIRSVISPEVAESMRIMLMGTTTSGGTGVKANVEGFLVGGKTGTAQKVAPNGGGYLNGAYISSFAGFIPAVDPKFVIYIAVDHPKKTSYYGSAVAAPVFSRVASYAVRTDGIAPVLLTEKNLIPSSPLKIADPPQPVFAGPIKIMPDLKNQTLRDVLRRLAGQDFQIKVIGSGVVRETFPPAGADCQDQNVITIYLDQN